MVSNFIKSPQPTPLLSRWHSNIAAYEISHSLLSKRINALYQTEKAWVNQILALTLATNITVNRNTGFAPAAFYLPLANTIKYNQTTGTLTHYNSALHNTMNAGPRDASIWVSQRCLNFIKVQQSFIWSKN